jgi:hypothetical protein
MTLAKTASVMLNKILIKVLLIALLLVLNEFAGSWRPCKLPSSASVEQECQQAEKGGWLQKKYQEYRADVQYLHLFLQAYKQIGGKS